MGCIGLKVCFCVDFALQEQILANVNVRITCKWYEKHISCIKNVIDDMKMYLIVCWAIVMKGSLYYYKFEVRTGQNVLLEAM